MSMAAKGMVEMVTGDVGPGAETCGQDHGIDGRPAKCVECREGSGLGSRGGIAGLMREGGRHRAEGVEQLEIGSRDCIMGIGGLHPVSAKRWGGSSNGVHASSTRAFAA